LSIDSKLNSENLLTKIAYVYNLLNGKKLDGKNATYHSNFKKARYASILLASVTLDNFKDEPCPNDCNSYNFYKLAKVAKTLELEFDRTRIAKKIYDEMIKSGEVKTERIEDKEYICITEKGKKICQKQLEELHLLRNYFEAIPAIQEKYNENQYPNYLSKGLPASIDPKIEETVEELINNISDGSTIKNKKALIIGISDYTHLQSLHFCKNDGETMSNILNSLDYKIFDTLIGCVKWDIMRDAIFDFFTDTRIKPNDTLIFYYSGHGVPDSNGSIYLSTSEINPDNPRKRGFSFDDLSRLIQECISTKIVVILDSCYSGSAKISKGHEEDVAKIASAAIQRQSNEINTGEGRCILAASQALQEAYILEEKNHSIFTYYLLQGLEGEDEEAVDKYGNVTVDTLGKYVYNKIMSLPPDKRPKQKPIRKVEASGDIILAHYPKFITNINKQDPKIIKSDLIKDNYQKEINNFKNLKSGSQLEAELRKIYENEGFIDIPQSAERLGTTKTKIRELISKMGLGL
jgi:hypothetical protein